MSSASQATFQNVRFTDGLYGPPGEAAGSLLVVAPTGGGSPWAPSPDGALAVFSTSGVPDGRVLATNSTDPAGLEWVTLPPGSVATTLACSQPVDPMANQASVVTGLGDTNTGTTVYTKRLVGTGGVVLETLDPNPMLPAEERNSGLSIYAPPFAQLEDMVAATPSPPGSVSLVGVSTGTELNFNTVSVKKLVGAGGATLSDDGASTGAVSIYAPPFTTLGDAADTPTPGGVSLVSESAGTVLNLNTVKVKKLVGAGYTHVAAGSGATAGEVTVSSPTATASNMFVAVSKTGTAPNDTVNIGLSITRSPYAALYLNRSTSVFDFSTIRQNVTVANKDNWRELDVFDSVESENFARYPLISTTNSNWFSGATFSNPYGVATPSGGWTCLINWQIFAERSSSSPSWFAFIVGRITTTSVLNLDYTTLGISRRDSSGYIKATGCGVFERYLPGEHLVILGNSEDSGTAGLTITVLSASMTVTPLYPS